VLPADKGIRSQVYCITENPVYQRAVIHPNHTHRSQGHGSGEGYQHTQPPSACKGTALESENGPVKKNYPSRRELCKKAAVPASRVIPDQSIFSRDV